MLKILVAEDDVSTNKLLCAILKINGYEAIPAFNGEAALDIIDHQHIDLLLCDVMMPKMDGFALTQAIRDGGSMMPILMLTAKALPEDKHTGFLVGTDDYMTKPPDKTELLLRIKALLRRARIIRSRWGMWWWIWTAAPCGGGWRCRPCRPRNLNCCTSCWPTRSAPLPGWNCWTRSGASTARATTRP